jgi:O-antigen/teichoic acid export membrane protein
MRPPGRHACPERDVELSAQDTAARFYRSAGAAAFSQFWRVGVTFAVDLLLRRWIPESDWGVWTWTLTAFLVLGAVRDLGLIYHVVRVRPRPYGNLLVLELGWGALLVATTFVGAPLLARANIDGGGDLVLVIRAMTLFLFFEGLASVPRTYFESELEVGRVVRPEILRNQTNPAFHRVSYVQDQLRTGPESMCRKLERG